jgi:uncharacterized protein YjbI with pentapeptide repeats
MDRLKLYDIILQGSKEWNGFRIKNDITAPDLSGLDLSKKTLNNYNFSKAILTGVNFSKSHLAGSDFSFTKSEKTNFRNAYLNKTKLQHANFKGSSFKAAVIRNSNFDEALFNFSNFDGATIKDSSFFRVNFRNGSFCSTKFIKSSLTKSHFEGSLFRNARIEDCNCSYVKLNDSKIIESDIKKSSFVSSMLYNSIIDDCKIVDIDFTRSWYSDGSLVNSTIENSVLKYMNFRNSRLNSNTISNSNFSYCKIYGVSAWDLEFIDTLQEELTITDVNDPIITIDNVEIAQFVYLLLNNKKLRTVIDTITSKVVLILGRFTSERLQILNEIRTELRNHNYLPILFDFDKAKNRDLTETVSTIAHLSKFVIADLSDPRSIPQELSTIIPNLPSLEVIPIIETGKTEYGMFEHFENYPWVHDVRNYKDINDLKSNVLLEIINSVKK